MTAPEATDPTPGEVRLRKRCIQTGPHPAHSWDGFPPDVWQCPGVTDHLNEDEKALLGEAFGGSSPSTLLTSRVERIVAAHLAARDAEVERLKRERDAAEHLLRQSMDRASAAEAEVADLRAKVLDCAREIEDPRTDRPGRQRRAEWAKHLRRAALGGEHA